MPHTLFLTLDPEPGSLARVLLLIRRHQYSIVQIHGVEHDGAADEQATASVVLTLRSAGGTTSVERLCALVGNILSVRTVLEQREG
jgi:acetolactate synthase regulatory subunit